VTVRVVLAAVVSLALVAATAPAVEHATSTRDAAVVDASADRVADAVKALHRRNDAAATVASAPRRTVELDLPERATLTVEQDPARLSSRLGGGPGHRRSLPVPVVVCGDDRELRGDTTLVYVRGPNGPIVVAVRGFIRGDGTTAAHACAPRTLRVG
jgi:hypothetical protein